MVTVKLMGGLGNQMFQYACGRSLAHALGENLLLDISYYDRRHSSGITPWKFELHHLYVQGEVLRRGFFSRYWMFILEKIVKVFPLLFPRYVLENELTYISNIEKKGKNLYLDGYWQCEKYFLHIADIIHQDFQVKTAQSELNHTYADLISNTNSICLHVRRGDYVTDPEANEIHGVCGPTYYHDAIRYMSNVVSDPVFFVFSDDIEWTKEHISIPFEVHYMDQNTSAAAYEDLRLMMSCKHFIIANSSFSWWGAWLGHYADKIVVCPKNWFADVNIQTDIICDSWIRV